MTIDETLKTALAEYEQRKNQLEAEFLAKRAELVSGIKGQLADKLSEAAKLYQAIPTGDRANLYSDATFSPIISSLGLGNGKPRMAKGRAKVSDDDILAYLASERRTNDVAGHCKLSKLTMGKRLETLLKAKKVSMRKEGTSKFWIKG